MVWSEQLPYPLQIFNNQNQEVAEINDSGLHVYKPGDKLTRVDILPQGSGPSAGLPTQEWFIDGQNGFAYMNAFPNGTGVAWGANGSSVTSSIDGTTVVQPSVILEPASNTAEIAFTKYANGGRFGGYCIASDHAAFIGVDDGDGQSHTFTVSWSSGNVWTAYCQNVDFFFVTLNDVAHSSRVELSGGEYVSIQSVNQYAGARYIDSAKNIGVFFRNDGTDFYCLKTAAADPYGTWDATRPWSIHLADGSMTIGKLNTTVDTGIAFSGWVDYGSGYSGATAIVSPDGIVTLQGLIKRSAASFTANGGSLYQFGALPANAQPANRVIVPIAATHQPAKAYIYPTGEIWFVLDATATIAVGDWFSISGITFSVNV